MSLTKGTRSVSAVDEKVELSSYATLINLKVVVPSTESSYVAVEKYFFAALMKSVIDDIDLDNEWYVRNYPDIRDAIRIGTVTSASDHYVRFGFFENRMPYKITVQEAWYLAAYPDIKAAIAEQAYPSGQAHFEDAGFAEGRLPHPDFRLRRRGQT